MRASEHITLGVLVKNKFVLPGAAAFAAAALSLCLGGGVAHAQEATDNSVTSVHVQAPRIVDTVRVTNDSPTPEAPVDGALAFLAESINLVGRDVLSQKEYMSRGPIIRVVDARGDMETEKESLLDHNLDDASTPDKDVPPILIAGSFAVPALAVPGSIAVGAIGGGLAGLIGVIPGTAAGIVSGTVARHLTGGGLPGAVLGGITGGINGGIAAVTTAVGAPILAGIAAAAVGALPAAGVLAAASAIPAVKVVQSRSETMPKELPALKMPELPETIVIKLGKPNIAKPAAPKAQDVKSETGKPENGKQTDQKKQGQGSKSESNKKKDNDRTGDKPKDDSNKRESNKNGSAANGNGGAQDVKSSTQPSTITVQQILDNLKNVPLPDLSTIAISNVKNLKNVQIAGKTPEEIVSTVISSPIPALLVGPAIAVPGAVVGGVASALVTGVVSTILSGVIPGAISGALTGAIPTAGHLALAGLIPASAALLIPATIGGTFLLGALSTLPLIIHAVSHTVIVLPIVRDMFLLPVIVPVLIGVPVVVIGSFIVGGLLIGHLLRHGLLGAIIAGRVLRHGVEILSALALAHALRHGLGILGIFGALLLTTGAVLPILGTLTVVVCIVPVFGLHHVVHFFTHLPLLLLVLPIQWFFKYLPEGLDLAGVIVLIVAACLAAAGLFFDVDPCSGAVIGLGGGGVCTIVGLSLLAAGIIFGIASPWWHLIP